MIKYVNYLEVFLMVIIMGDSIHTFLINNIYIMPNLLLSMELFPVFDTLIEIIWMCMLTVTTVMSFVTSFTDCYLIRYVRIFKW